MSASRSIRRCALAVALGATGGCASVAGEEAARPAAPPVVALADPVAAYPDDGLHRLVVAPTPPPPADAPPSARPGDADGDGNEWVLDAETVSAMPPGAELVERDGAPGYLDADGAFVSLVEGAGGEEPSQALAGADLAAALAELEGVERVSAIGDGSYAVVVVDPEVLDALPVQVSADPPFVLAGDPYEVYQWAIENDGSNLDGVTGAPIQVVDADIDGLEARAGQRGTGVVVAVVDTGVDFGHPDLAGQSWTNSDEDCSNGRDDDGNGYIDDCRGWDFHAEDNTPYASGNNAHGTHVAGIIAASAGNGEGVAGIAPGVLIMDLQVAPGGPITASAIARAIRYAADNGADVVNLSICSAPGTPLEAVLPIVDAVRYAESKGVLLVAAAGNNGVDISGAPVYPASTEAANMLSIGASTAGEQRARFSNYGSTVDLFAPGHLVLSTVPGGYSFLSGTSMASPMVAAVAATVIGHQPGIEPPALISQLVGTGDEIAAYAGVSWSGMRLNAARAVGVDPSPGDTVSISGLAGASVDGVRARVEVSEPAAGFGTDVAWDATVVALTSSGPYGLVELPVIVDGEATTSDGRGAVRLTTAATDSVRLETDLPPGDYALLVEAVPLEDPTIRLGAATAAVFRVADPTAATTTTTAPDTAATTSTTAPTGGTTTTGVAPWWSTTTTAASGISTTTSTAAPWRWWTTTSGAVGPGTTPTATAAPAPTGPAATTVAPGPTAAAGEPVATSSPGAATTAIMATWPTAAPATTSATTISPTTTVPTMTSPTTTWVGGAAGEWSISSITPRTAPIGEPIPVSLVGTFPAPVNVWFGDQAGTVHYQSLNWLVVTAPAATTPGVVDVSLRNRASGTVLTVPGAFTYHDPDGGSGPAPTASPTTAPSAGAPTTAPGGGSPTSEPTASTTTTTTAATTTTAVAAAVPPAGRAALLGPVVDLGGGLRGVPLGGLDDLSGLPPCSSDPCRSRNL